MNTTNTIKVTKMNFAGMQLDVITGHPDHELLFVASQVATVIGLRDPKTSIRKFQMRTSRIGKMLQVRDLGLKVDSRSTLKDCPRWLDVWLLTEEALYEMLLAGNAPQTEPFRKWVTEEVLPTIRKTGSYNVETSKTPEGIQFASEFAALRSQMGALRTEIAELKGIIQAQPKVTVSARRLGLYYRVCPKIHDKAHGSAPEETPYVSIGLN